MSGHWAWLTWTDGRRSGGRHGRQVASADRNRGLGRRRASQNREVTPRGVAYEDVRTGGWVQAIPQQSGVTACTVKSILRNTGRSSTSPELAFVSGLLL